MKLTNNAAVHVECQLLKHVVASTTEAECGTLFHNTQLAVPIKKILKELGHKQLTTPPITDKSTAAVFYNK